MPVNLKKMKGQMRRLPRDEEGYGKRDNVRRLLKPVEVSAAPGTKQVTFRSKIEGRGDTPDTRSYDISVTFRDAYIEDSEKPGYIKAAVTGDRDAWVRPPSLASQDVALKCTCRDFRFTWEYSLAKGKGLIGNWQRYTRKTPPPPNGYPYRNPDDIPGYCKHVYHFVGILKRMGYVTERRA